MQEFSIKGTPSTGLWGATLGFFTGFAAVSLFGPTVKFFETSVGLNPALAGLLISIPNLTGSILRIPFSAWVDTTGGRTPFALLLGLSIIGLGGLSLILSLDRSMERELFFLFLIFGALGGCGIATFSVGISQTSYWFPQKQQGKALGIYAGVGNVAPGLFAFLLTNLAIPFFGLAGSYLVWFLFLIVGTLVYLLIGRNAAYFQLLRQGLEEYRAREIAMNRYGQKLFPRERMMNSLLISARRWQTWALVAVYFATFGGFMALTGWFPKYWIAFHGTSLQIAGILTMSYSILASLIRVAGGFVSDRLGGEQTAFLSLHMMLVGSLILMFTRSLPLAVLGTILMALGMGITNAAVFKLVPREVPDAVGGAAGWVGGLGAFGGFVLPNVLAAFLSDGGIGDIGYSQGFVVFTSLAVVALLSILILQKAGKGKD